MLIDKVQVVFSGHDHTYQRFRPKSGIHYIVAGAGGKSLYELGSSDDLLVGLRRYSYVLCEANARELSIRTLGIDGSELDALSIKRD